MRLRNDYASLEYAQGDFVHILPDLRAQEHINITHGGRRLRAGIGNGMERVQGRLVRIMAIRTGLERSYVIDQDARNIYSADMFLESYISDEEFEQEEQNTLLYQGIYLFDIREQDAGNPGLYRVRNRDFTNEVSGLFIRREDKNQRNLDVDLDLHTWTINELTWMRYGRTFANHLNIREHDGRQFVTTYLYIPNNDVLMDLFGVSNREYKPAKKVEGHLDLPTVFEGSKYPVVNLRFTNDSSYVIQSEYGFKISSKILVTINGKSKVSKKINNIISEYKVTNNEKHLKHILLDWAKPTVKSYEKSVELFGHKTRKKAMFEATDDKGKKKVFKLTSIKFNYDKEGTFYHVVELNDGTLNLKFLLEDIDLNLPTVNDYVAPKDRTIKAQDECKLVNNKITPVQKNSTVKVIKMFNRHQVHNPRLGVYDKNTIAIVVDKSTNKQFECKIKQLKKI